MKLDRLITAWSIILFIGFSCSDLYGQCDFEKNEIDDFTGKLHIDVKIKTVQSDLSGGFGFGTEVIDSVYYLKVRCSRTGNQPLAIKEDAELIIITTGGSKIYLRSAWNELPQVQVDNGMIMQWVVGHYRISKQDIYLLRNQSIDKFRMYLTSGYVDCDIKPKKQRLVQDQINCILK